MRIVAADSGAALLNASYEPLSIVAASVVLVEPPYRRTSKSISEAVSVRAENGHDLIIHELELCQKMLRDSRADLVHLDVSLGGILVEEISPVHLRGKTRNIILKILPQLRKISATIKRTHGIDVIAIGKESVPVRIAELTTGAHAILYTCEKVIKDDRELMLGLPSRCIPKLTQEGIELQSLIAAEHDIAGYAEDHTGVLDAIDIVEMLNPQARGFRVLKIAPKTE